MDALLTSPLARAGLLVAVLALTSLAWYVASRRSGQVRAVAVRTSEAAPVFDLAAVGASAGSSATFVQFSSAVCSPCRHVARVLTALSATEHDVAHVEIDVAAHPELVREHGILRTPTVLLLGSDGKVRGRASGPMTTDQARAALAALGLAPTSAPGSTSAPAALLDSRDFS